MTTVRSVSTSLLLAALIVGCGGSDPQPDPVAAAPIPTVEMLLDSAMRGSLAEVERQIAAGADVNGVDEDGRTALMYAAFDGHTAVVKALLDAGATVDTRDPDGRPALMFAATGPFPETVELLLESGADPQITDTGERFTALMHAAAEGHAPVVQVLLRYGADPAVVDVDGDTALSFARQNGHAAAVALLTATPD